MGTKGVPLPFLKRMLEQRPKDFRTHFRPVRIGGLLEQAQFVGGEFNSGGIGKQPAVEVVDPLLSPPARPARRVHLDEESTQDVVGVLRTLAVQQELGHGIFFEQANVIGEE